MANEGHIIVKKGRGRPSKGDPRSVSRFYRPVDGKSARPVFCYPGRVDGLRDEVKSMEQALEHGMVTPERKMEYEQRLKNRKKKLTEMEASFSNAVKVINEDKDAWIARREELKNQIIEQTPTRKDYEMHRVNPHAVLRREKHGEKDKRPLEEVKREYTIISRALQAAGDDFESNHSFLQKEK